MVVITLKKGRDAAVKRFHPWVLSGAIHKIKGDVTDGSIVEVRDAKGNFLALGHYQNGSIAVRLFAFNEVELGLPFWEGKLQAALNYRQAIGIAKGEHTNSFRLVHAEGDGLPGLIIDIYNRNAIIQCHSIGMHKERAYIAEALLKVFGGELDSIYDKSKESLPRDYAATVQNEILHGIGTDTIITENGNQFFVNWETGQKTGFFLDQRDNRQLLGTYAKGKSVLNTFCYSGGFSIYALNQGATKVDSIDASKKAMEWTDQNVELSQSPDLHTSHVGDVMKFFKEDIPEYDLMIVDPPAFAKSFNKRHNAVQGYKRLNAAALSKMKSGGILFTFSCSQVVGRELFYNTITAAAIEARRHVKVMKFLSQPADHPISLFHPEGEYLKGLVLYVE
jgi:23S rRNA (cytosine1962-C5)-methyltransferase